MKFCVMFADTSVEVECIHPFIREFCAEYLTTAAPQVYIRITPDAVEAERCRTEAGHPPQYYEVQH